MSSKILHYFELAADIAVSKSDQRNQRLGSCAIRTDGAVVLACNSPSENKKREVHSEFKCSRKIDYYATIYVVRIRKDTNDFAMARPCVPCQGALRAKRIHKVYYTISPSEYGILDVYSGIDRFYCLKR